MLLQELKKEKMKAAAAVKELQEKTEQKLMDELQRKVCQMCFGVPYFFYPPYINSLCNCTMTDIIGWGSKSTSWEGTRVGKSRTGRSSCKGESIPDRTDCWSRSQCMNLYHLFFYDDRQCCKQPYEVGILQPQYPIPILQEMRVIVARVSQMRFCSHDLLNWAVTLKALVVAQKW